MRFLVLWLLIVPAVGWAQTCPDVLRAEVGGYVQVDGNVDPRLCSVVLEGVRAMPASLRPRLRLLSVVRLPDPPGVREPSLAERLAAATRLAVYHPASRTVVITDAGARGEPRWTGGRASEDEVRRLLEGLGGLLGVAPDGPAGLRMAWAALAARVEVTPAPPVGSASVLDALVRRAGPMSLQEAVAGALGQAALLPRGVPARCPCTDAPACEATPDRCPLVAAWLSGEPGWAGEGASAEARVRALVAGAEAGPASPAEAIGRVYRAALGGPDDVHDENAVQVLAVLAAEQLAEPRWQRWLARHAPGLLASAEPAVIEALQAHAGALSAAAGPGRDQAPATIPDDLPEAVAERLPPERFELRIGDAVLRPPPERVREVLVRAARGGDATGAPPPRVADAVTAATSGAADADRRIEEAGRALLQVGLYERSLGRAWLARARAHRGQVGEALAQVRDVQGEIFGRARRLSALLDVAAIRIGHADWSGTQRALDAAVEAIRAAGSPPDLAARAAELHGLAGAHEKVEDVLRALDVPPDLAAGVLARVADWLGAEGATEEAGAHARRAATLLDEADEATRVHAAPLVARALVRALGPTEGLAYVRALPVLAQGPGLAAVVAALPSPKPALKVAAAATPPEARPWLRAQVVWGLLQAGREKAVTAALPRALAAARRAPPSALRSLALETLATIQLDLGDLRGAELTAWEMDPRHLSTVPPLALVARAHLARGDLKEAERVAHLVRLHDLRQQLLEEVRAAR